MQVLSNYWMPTVRAANNLVSVNSKDCTKKKKSSLRSGKFPATFMFLACVSNPSLTEITTYIGLFSCLGSFLFGSFWWGVSWFLTATAEVLKSSQSHIDSDGWPCLPSCSNTDCTQLVLQNSKLDKTDSRFSPENLYCLKHSPLYIQTVAVQNYNSHGHLLLIHPRLEFSSWKVSLSPVDLTFVNTKSTSNGQIHNKMPFF